MSTVVARPAKALSKVNEEKTMEGGEERQTRVQIVSR